MLPGFAPTRRRHERTPSPGRGEQAGGHGQRRRFTSAVRTNDPVEGSGGDVEGQVSNSDEVAINLTRPRIAKAISSPTGAAGSVSDTTGSFTREMPVDFTAVPSLIQRNISDRDP